MAGRAIRHGGGIFGFSTDALYLRETLRDGALFTQRTGGPPTRATPASPTRFFYRTSLSHFNFEVTGDRVTAMVSGARTSDSE